MVVFFTLTLPINCALIYTGVAICGALTIAVVPTIIIPAFYILGLIIFIRMFIVQCCKPKKVKNSKKAKIDEMIENRKKEL